MRSAAELQEQGEANRQKLVKAEAAALLLLRRRTRESLTFGAPLARQAHRLEAGAQSAITEGRALARGIGVGRLAGELESLGLTFVDASEELAFELFRDAERAQYLAGKYAERWLRLAQADERAATAAIKTTAERIGVSESAEAFNSGRAKAATAQSVALMRVWDAQLDKRSCMLCSKADGTIVGVSEPFPDGEPGAVHPYCRCSWTLLTSSEADSKLFIKAA